MQEFFEMLMIASFGVSWPISILKSYMSKTNKGKSIWFIILILFGYGLGITSKLISGKLTYVFIFYCINFVLVALDICLYVRNSKLDKKNFH